MAEETLKFCNKCQLSKPLTDFYIKKRPTYIDYYPDCKSCTNIIRQKKAKQLKEQKLAELQPRKIDILHREIRGAIGNLSDEQFKLACEMVKNGCSVSKLSRFIDCCPITAKKYVDMGLFNN
jgi:hypothetical protein